MQNIFVVKNGEKRSVNGFACEREAPINNLKCENHSGHHICHYMCLKWKCRQCCHVHMFSYLATCLVGFKCLSFSKNEAGKILSVVIYFYSQIPNYCFIMSYYFMAKYQVDCVPQRSLCVTFLLLYKKWQLGYSRTSKSPFAFFSGWLQNELLMHPIVIFQLYNGGYSAVRLLEL